MKVRLQIGRNNKGEISRFEGEPDDFLATIPPEYRVIVKHAIASTWERTKACNNKCARKNWQNAGISNKKHASSLLYGWLGT